MHACAGRTPSRAAQYDRTRAIFKYALDKLPKERAKEVFAAYTQFEKKHGNRTGVEDLVLSKRRFQYEKEVQANSHNYDAWFDYARLMETEADVDKAREVYERAIANVPPTAEKRFWRRYIYLWIYYAIFEELEAQVRCCRCLSVANLRRTWSARAPCTRRAWRSSRTRSSHLPRSGCCTRSSRSARRTCPPPARSWSVPHSGCRLQTPSQGRALGVCPKGKLFKSYIELELQVRSA